MPLAEAVTLDGGFLAVVLITLLALLGSWIAAVVAAWSFARRAGRGSVGAHAGWVVAGAVELAPLLLPWPARSFGVGGLVALALQALAYQRARTGGPPPPPPVPPP